MRRFSQRSHLVTLSEINITPLLDLAFVLLVIFIITTPLLEKGLNVNLPKATAQPDKQIKKEDIRTVEIDPKGIYSINKRQMKLDQLVTQLVQDFKYHPNLVIFIRADENSRTKDLAALIDACQRNGLTKVLAAHATPGAPMNRTQKKCFMAATGMHVLLLAILFVGPAFLSSSKQSDNRPPIDFVALKTIDEALAGGGSPNARPPAPIPTPPKFETPQPAPPAPPVQKPAPPHVEKLETPRLETPDPDAVSIKPVRKLPNVTLKPVVRPKNPGLRPKPTTDTASQTDADEKPTRLASAAQSAVKDLRRGLSSGTTIDIPPGPGGGGVPYANFYDAVKKVYSDAWIVPDGVTDDEATATVSVTIAREGTVVDSRVIQRSGNSLADQSVEMALRRVTFAAPLPDGAKESQRTVKIKFNVKAKRGLG